MAKDMQEASDGIREAGQDIVEAVAVLQKDDKSTEAKTRILDAGKAILKHMVRLLQLNDLYEVTVILKQIQAVRQLLQGRDNRNFAVSEFTLMSNYLSKILTARTKRCHDGSVRALLEESAIEIGRSTIPMLEVLQQFLDNPQQLGLKDRREMYASTLTFALKKAHDATKLSARSPFDLSMLDRANDMDFDEDFVALSNANWDTGLDALQQAIKNGDEVELESALRALKKDVLSQLDAAEEQANSIADPAVREKMLDTLARFRKQLENMMDKLSSDARKALKNRDPDAVKAALDELRSLRARALDGLAKDNLLQHAVNIDSLMRSLIEAARAGDVRESKAIVNDIGNEVDDLDQLVSTLAANITDDASRRKRLEDDLVSMKKHLAAIGHVTNQVLEDPNNDQLWNTLQDLMDRIRGVTNDLVNASLQTTPQELLAHAANFNDALKRLLEAGEDARNNPDNVTVAAANAISKLKPGLELASRYAEGADPHTRATIEKKVEEARGHAAQMVAAAKDMVSKSKAHDWSGLGSAFDKLKSVLDQLRDCNGAIVAATIADPEAEMRALKEQMESARARLEQALKDGDIKGAVAALSDFQAAGRRNMALARILAAETDDEELKRQLLELAQQLERDLGMDLLGAVKEVFKNPGNKAIYEAALAKFNKALATTAALDKLASAVSPEEKYAANGKLLVRTAEIVKHNVNDGNFTEAGAMLKALRDQLASHRQLATQIGDANSHDPSVKKRLMAQVDQLEDTYKKIVTATAAAASETNPAAAATKRAAVDALVAEFQKIAAKSAEEAQKAKESAAAEKKRQEEEAAEAARRRKLEEEDLAGKNEIYRAAHKVTQAVNAADDIPLDGSPSSKLIVAASKVATAMKLLSELSETADKAANINQARQIAALVAEVHKYANEAAADCSDPKLAQELRDTANVAKNFGIQLKIVCAVKASSGDDSTAQKSLITCAQGLCKNVVNCVDVARVAKLKKKLRDY